MHRIFLTGNLGADPRVNYTADGMAIANFSVAVNEYFSGENHTAWMRVSVFGKRAETCAEYLRKGSKVAVVGRLSFDPETGGPRTYFGSEGIVRSGYDIRADEVQFMSGIASREDGNGAASNEAATSVPPQNEPEDIPF